MGLSAVHNVSSKWLSELERVRNGELNALLREEFCDHFASEEELIVASERLADSL